MKKINLGKKDEGRNQNLAFLKFIAATLVILSHAGPLACGATNILVKWTSGSVSLGVVAVSIFFLTGGFYNAKSMLKKETAKQYFKARIEKIFPPLIAVVVISIAAGSFLTTCEAKEYWTDTGTWKYLGNGLLLLQHNLPGVFEGNPYNSTVNGSLWTLPVEFLCYIACYLFYRLRILSNKFWISTPIVLGMVIGYEYFMDIPVINSMIKPCLMFYIGMGLYVYRDKINISAIGNMIAVSVFLLLIVIGWGDLAVIFAFPYVIMYIIFGLPQCGKYLAELGKISYGMYLCAFPIQQCIALISDSPLVNFALALPLAMLGGWLLYQCVERPVAARGRRMSLKKE